MEETINLPRHMDLRNALSFCSELEKYDYEDIREIVYQTPKFGVCDPLGMLLVGAKIREIEKQNEHITYCYYPVKEPHSYAAHMGFYQSIGLPYGNEPGAAPGSRTYVPISKLTVDDIKATTRSKRVPVGEIVEGYAEELAKILYSRSNEAVEHMSFAIREIMRNVVEHSQSEAIWYAGQVWKTYGLVEIAILDDGVGIYNTLRANKYYSKLVSNNLDALRFSLEPGITRSFDPKRRAGEELEDGWQNTGFGLYMTSNICSAIGDFVILSGEDMIQRYGKKEELHKSSFLGTAIRMRLRLSEVTKVTDLRKQLIREGEANARKNSKAIAKASKASELSFMTR